MAYRKDFRWGVVNNVKPDMTWNEVVDIFRISRQTWSNWLKRADKNRELSNPPRREYQTRKLAANELKERVEKPPDLTLAEYAEHFRSESPQKTRHNP
jgi:transposase